MTIKVQQTWWHIEDIYYPSSGRIIRQVMDIFTDKSVIDINSLDGNSFVGLKVRSRNSPRREIAFIEIVENGESKIKLNLAPLSEYPSAFNNNPETEENQPETEEIKPKTEENGLRHVKLEIEYILTNVEYEDVKDNWYRFSRKKATQEISGHIHPEFYIIVPLGWEIYRPKDGDDIYLECTISKKDSEKETIGMTNSGSTKEKLSLNDPFIKLVDGNRKYNYLINSKSFNDLKQKIKPNSEISYKFSYETKRSGFAVGIGLLQFPILIVSLILWGLSFTLIFAHYLDHPIKFSLDGNLAIGFLIVLLGYEYYYSSFIREGFDIPLNEWFTSIFVVSILAVFTVLISSVI